MKNTGTKIIDMDVYGHDFYRLDELPTRPDTVLHFAFEPKPARPLTNGGEIKGKDLMYASELKTGQTVSSGLTGYSNNPSDCDFNIENVKAGFGVEQTSGQPIASLNFWSVPATIAPEAYIHIHIAQGESQDYTIRYRFYAK